MYVKAGEKAFCVEVNVVLLQVKGSFPYVCIMYVKAAEGNFQ